MTTEMTLNHEKTVTAERAPGTAGPDRATLKAWYQLMQMGRVLDDKAPNYLKQAIGWSYHAPCAGHDGIQLALGLSFRAGHDFMFPYYRDLLTCLAAGLTPLEVILNGISKATDVAGGGRHMSNHFAKPAIGIQNGSSCTGNHTQHAVGLARAVKAYGSDAIVFCSQGESSASEGYVYEAVNGANLEKVPVIFVLQDNGYGISKATDVAGGGRHMSNHFAKPAIGIQNVSSCTGNHTLHAVGLARAVKTYGSDAIVFCSQGESSVSEGYVSEAINGASLERLPVLFVFQDNGFGISVPKSDQTANEFVCDNFRGFPNLLILKCDGKDPIDSMRALDEAVAYAKSGAGAAIIQADCVRIGSHSNSDKHELYRSPEELAAARAKDLTQQLLTFARGGEPVKKVVEVKGLLKEAAAFALLGSNVGCVFDIAGDLWAVEADEGQLVQVIHNLMINAVQAMPEGGAVRLSARNIGTLQPGEGCVEISVSDSGAGIAEQHLERIFDPYFTTKQQGSGLGLASCYSIIKKHGGNIRVESVLGQGSTFHVLLPASQQIEPATPDPGPALTRGNSRVLVMDDEEIVRVLAKAILEQLGYQAECTADGAQAVECYRKAREEGVPFAAVILDLTVPGGTGGREAIKMLIELDPQVKAIVCSGYSTDPIMANHRQYGFSAVLAKPYRPHDLSRVLQELLGGC